ncbi:hypothetical protein [Paraflavitalea speifideaquila]|uniref:hypothetical protein n=1 Tax=Paraflavitalea speifideaquila TaxID=3076558 RepID=UPI0028E5C245|nr:hypothetical protein [Paraflavitalea speifideiaquila]
MKKESKNYKALYSRFILLVIFMAIFVDGIFAQCVENIPASCTSCVHSVNVTQTCFAAGCYAAPSLTDLKNTGVGPAASVTINATGFAKVTAVKISDINIYDAATPCNTVSGGHYTSSSAFNDALLGITIADGTTSTTITAVANALIGYRLNFIVNVYNGDAIIASRSFFTKMPSATLIVGDTHITTVDGVKYDFKPWANLSLCGPTVVTTWKFRPAKRPLPQAAPEMIHTPASLLV